MYFPSVSLHDSSKSWPVLFLFKILNRNHIMYGKEKKHTDLQSVPPTYYIFTVQTALQWRRAVTACLTWLFLPVVTAQKY